MLARSARGGRCSAALGPAAGQLVRQRGRGRAPLLGAHARQPSCPPCVAAQELRLDDNAGIGGPFPNPWRLPSGLRSLYLTKMSLNGSLADLPPLPVGLEELSLALNGINGG